MWIWSCCCSPLRCWFLLFSLRYLRLRRWELPNCSSILLEPRHLALSSLGRLHGLCILGLPWVAAARGVRACMERALYSLWPRQSVLEFLVVRSLLIILNSHGWRRILRLLPILPGWGGSSVVLHIHLLATAQACGAWAISWRHLGSSCLAHWNLGTSLLSRHKLILLPLHIEYIGSPPWREALTTHLWGQTFFTWHHWDFSCFIQALSITSHLLALL